jgi:altronate hydrolase
MNVVTIESMLRPQNPFIRLSPKDNVVVARVPLSAGATVQFEGREIHLRQAIGQVTRSLFTIKAETVYKYGENIGGGECRTRRSGSRSQPAVRLADQK